jgi:hypothetical protein
MKGEPIMAKFYNLNPTNKYDIINGETGNWRSVNLEGARAMSLDWDSGDQAWPQKETKFIGKPVDIAE